MASRESCMSVLVFGANFPIGLLDAPDHKSPESLVFFSANVRSIVLSL